MEEPVPGYSVPVHRALTEHLFYNEACSQCRLRQIKARLGLPIRTRNGTVRCAIYGWEAEKC